MKKININLLPGKGICETCEENTDCPMIDMLNNHRENLRIYGVDLQAHRPDLWDEYAIDEPEFKENTITWCPLHYKGE